MRMCAVGLNWLHLWTLWRPEPPIGRDLTRSEQIQAPFWPEAIIIALNTVGRAGPASGGDYFHLCLEKVLEFVLYPWLCFLLLFIGAVS